ncbi:MAG: hypothetical protein MJK15_00680 [Colwellia sp.]|nr:hypothetical protein [Colwellia sp.]
MKNGIEIRKHGLKITKKIHNKFPMYQVAGSRNGPWDYLHNARKDADTQLEVEPVIEAMENGATHYDNVNKRWLRSRIEELHYYTPGNILGGQGWVPMRGINIEIALSAGTCINLEMYLNSDHNHFLSPPEAPSHG